MENKKANKLTGFLLDIMSFCIVLCIILTSDGFNLRSFADGLVLMHMFGGIKTKLFKE